MSRRWDRVSAALLGGESEPPPYPFAMGRSTRDTLVVYFSISLAGIVLAVGIVFTYGTWPEATPLMFATLVSGAIVLGYIAWRRYFS